ncbi:MAG: hypothetical protein CMN77_04850 [Spirochaetaceae bacterium]|nr:hypothetical protein [Spirochaetaceae bacterium]
MSGPGLREHRKAANRAAIVKGATRVFSEMGFESCTVRDIVRASGLAAGTFYNYFQSKEEVLESIIQEVSSEVRAVVRRARRDAASGKAFVEEGYLGFFRSSVPIQVCFLCWHGIKAYSDPWSLVPAAKCPGFR